MVAEFRKTDQATPVVLMGYLNPIEVMGYQAFAEKASAAGVDGVLTVDLPPEEAIEFNRLMRESNVDVIYLLAPTTEEERVRQVCDAGSGYVYYVSVKGVTGSASLNVAEVAEKVEMIRRHTDLPIGVGFGIRDDESARAISEVADGVIVGSVLVNKIAELSSNQEQIPEAVAAITASMRQAMDK
jgi:tryptophan synthase alpha chain